MVTFGYETQYDLTHDPDENISSISIILQNLLSRDYQDGFGNNSSINDLLDDEVYSDGADGYQADFKDIIVFCCFLVVIIYATIGNALVCVAILTDRHLRKLSNFFLISLAVADLFVSMFVMTMAVVNEFLGYWPSTAAFCSVWIASDITCSTCSILNLCAISADRYINIKWPLRYQSLMNRKRVTLIIVLIWLISLLLSTIPLSAGWHRSEDAVDLSIAFQNTSHPTCTMELNMYYSTISSSISFFLPCTIMVVIYVRLYLIARSQVKAMQKSVQVTKHFAARNNPGVYKYNKRQYRHRLSNYKALITLGIIMGVFLVCWTPFFICNVVVSFCPTCVGQTLFSATTWAGYLNSACNPLIYSIFNVQFRKAFKKIICKFLCGRRVDPSVDFDMITSATYSRRGGRTSSDAADLNDHLDGNAEPSRSKQILLKTINSRVESTDTVNGDDVIVEKETLL